MATFDAKEYHRGGLSRRTDSEPLASPLSGNFFYELVHFAAARGGARGGAFPSSHVSISTVIVVVTAKYQPRWLYWLMPIYLGLVAATVYGRFHHALDVLAGWALALILVGLFRLRSAVTHLPATASHPADGSL